MQQRLAGDDDDQLLHHTVQDPFPWPGVPSRRPASFLLYLHCKAGEWWTFYFLNGKSRYSPWKLGSGLSGLIFSATLYFIFRVVSIFKMHNTVQLCRILMWRTGGINA